MTARRDAAGRDAARQELYQRVKQGDLGLADAVRMMRRIAGKTQAEYAKLVGVSPRVLIDFERGVGNPTVRTLRRMLEPFGLDLTVRRRGLDGAVEDDLAQARRPLRGAPQKVLPELRRRVAKIANDSRVERFFVGRSTSPSKRAVGRGAYQRVLRLYVTNAPSQASEVETELVRTIAGHPKSANEPRSGERSAADGGDRREMPSEPAYVYIAMTTRPE
jgi:transcriptional regulator with XRE-family HTH domain